eukprot:132113-Chlamydomonas_euryale.AAC.2
MASEDIVWWEGPLCVTPCCLFPHLHVDAASQALQEVPDEDAGTRQLLARAKEQLEAGGQQPTLARTEGIALSAAMAAA